MTSRWRNVAWKVKLVSCEHVTSLYQDSLRVLESPPSENEFNSEGFFMEKRNATTFSARLRPNLWFQKSRSVNMAKITYKFHARLHSLPWRHKTWMFLLASDCRLSTSGKDTLLIWVILFFYILATVRRWSGDTLDFCRLRCSRDFLCTSQYIFPLAEDLNSCGTSGFRSL